MPDTIPSTVKTYVFVGLFVLMTGASLGTVESLLAETPMDGDMVMSLETNDNYGDEAEMFNNVLNVFTAAFLITGGNMEVVVIDPNTICISPAIEDCAHSTSSHGSECDRGCGE